MNISFNGTNIFQSSNGNVEFTVNNYGVGRTHRLRRNFEPEPWRTKAIDDMFGNDPFRDTYAGVLNNHLESSIEFQKPWVKS